MPVLRLPLIADINSKQRENHLSTLVPKYICRITAEDLAPLLAYTRTGKKFPFQILPSSTIILDPNIQRGLTDEGRIHQDASKIDEIKNILLGSDNALKKAFLGTLVWNIRAGANFKVIKVSAEDEPPEYELRIDTPKIYLTDSAHRHLGICEAFLEYNRNNKAHPRFDPKYEFAVEIYNLNAELENQLFYELNAKQKKISPAKERQVDVTTPVGLMKTHILQYDLANEGLFVHNIEVNTVTNERHTLMTMSVFTGAIKEMFGDAQLKEAMEDDDLRDQLAQYFCEFFYTLKKHIVIKCPIRGHDTEVRPFESLYKLYIEPVENKDFNDEAQRERELSLAREKARDLNRYVRDQDKINSNPFVRSLAYIGGRVIAMDDWKQCIEKLQTDIIAPAGGKFFQAGNPRMTTPDPETGHPIATLTDDGTLNVQVQTHTLRTIKKFFEKELDLLRPPQAALRYQDVSHEYSDEKVPFTLMLSRASETYADFVFAFFVGSKVPVAVDALKLRIEGRLADGTRWNEFRYVGQAAKLPVEVEEASGYEDPVYGTSIKKYVARFNLDFPIYTREVSGQFEINLTVTYPDLAGNALEHKLRLTLQPV